jgi:hypothetical protein
MPDQSIRHPAGFFFGRARIAVSTTSAQRAAAPHRAVLPLE